VKVLDEGWIRKVSGDEVFLVRRSEESSLRIEHRRQKRRSGASGETMVINSGGKNQWGKIANPTTTRASSR
jgi:hypothetical protein